jgi:hypothetical protein
MRINASGITPPGTLKEVSEENILTDGGSRMSTSIERKKKGVTETSLDEGDDNDDDEGRDEQGGCQSSQRKKRVKSLTKRDIYQLRMSADRRRRERKLNEDRKQYAMMKDKETKKFVCLFEYVKVYNYVCPFDAEDVGDELRDLCQLTQYNSHIKVEDTYIEITSLREIKDFERLEIDTRTAYRTWKPNYSNIHFFTTLLTDYFSHYPTNPNKECDSQLSTMTAAAAIRNSLCFRLPRLIHGV